MLSARRDAIAGFPRFMAAPFLLLRIPPNAITVAGALLAFVPAGLLVERDYLWGAVALLFAAGFDMVDGVVARATGRASAFGGYLDSVLDRYADAIVLLGIGIGLDDPVAWGIVGFGLMGQYGTSYARARAYQDVAPPAETWNQFFERPERVFFLVLLLAVQGTLDLVRPELRILLWGLGLYAVVTNLTAVRRILKVRKILQERNK